VTDFAPFDVNLVAARIKDQVDALILVGNAADYAAVRSLADFRPPCAFVVLATERGDQSATGSSSPGTQSAMRQRTVAQFGVVVAARNYRAGTGAAAADDLRPLLAAVRAAVVGWTPETPGGRPCQFLRGDLTSYDGATALWTDVFQTQHFIG